MERLTYIQQELFKLQDTSYRDFHSALMPNIDKALVIGVRTPELRRIAKKLWNEQNGLCREFMCNLPHKYYEENNLHAVFLQNITSYEECIEELDKFLPYVDNWATCDMISPKALTKDIKNLEKIANLWICSKDEYTVRYGIGVFMEYFLEENFDERQMKKIANIKSDKY